MARIDIQMLGDFCLKVDGVLISDSNKRARKIWGLMAYLICNRKSVASQKLLIGLLYGEEIESVNPENALRITMHRMRATLDALWAGAGKSLILYKDGGYGWNSEVEIDLDCERFDNLIACEGEERLDKLMEALELYQGEFLPRHSEEGWVIPIATYFHNRFVEATIEASRELIKLGRYEKAASICRRGIESEPYHEPIHQMLMQALGGMRDTKGAAACYEALRKRLFDDFGIYPSEETRAIYRASAFSPEDRTLPIDEVLDHLKEPDSTYGAMVCDYDYFKFLCFTESRTIERSGHSTHIALLNVVSNTDEALSKRSQNRIVEQLGEHIRLNLRRGDTMSRCSVSQYIMLLPKANYENSCMVCRRVIAAFNHAHPRAAVKIHYMVQPLGPGISVP